jgi:hypothetical protein
MTDVSASLVPRTIHVIHPYVGVKHQDCELRRGRAFVHKTSIQSRSAEMAFFANGKRAAAAVAECSASSNGRRREVRRRSRLENMIWHAFTRRGGAGLPGTTPEPCMYLYKAIFSIVTGCKVNSEGQGQLAAALHQSSSRPSSSFQRVLSRSSSSFVLQCGDS